MAAERRLGKGTTVDLQVCIPIVLDGPWLSMGCHFGVQPPSCQWDSITGEQCLEDTDQPTTDLGDLQADNPTFTTIFDAGDDEVYQMLEDWCASSECILFRYTYNGGATHFFYARIQNLVPDEIERNTFMRTVATLLRTSKVYRTFAEVPTDTNFSCSTCREVA